MLENSMTTRTVVENLKIGGYLRLKLSVCIVVDYIHANFEHCSRENKKFVKLFYLVQKNRLSQKNRVSKYRDTVCLNRQTRKLLFL